VALKADYPLAVALNIRGALANSPVECPSHPMTRAETGECVRYVLQDGAKLDRDVVWVVTPRSTGQAFWVQANDKRSPDAPHTMMLALPVSGGPARAQIALKLLVDCSGSMNGDSIESARRALHGVLEQTTQQDLVSLTRFGGSVHHVMQPSLCTPVALKALSAGIDQTHANLGGTEMEKALRAVCTLPLPKDSPAADILLITDGEIWQVDSMIDTARRSAHRVFVIGVGTSPAEGVLRRLAESTGGACEFATPGEALEAAAGRMMARIRQVACKDVNIDWGCKLVWQSPLPLCAFGGDTLVAFAGLPANATPNALAVHAALNGAGQVILASARQCTHADGDALPRLGAATRLPNMPEAAATALAVQYQLMSPNTNCVMVHQRADVDKPTDEAELHRIESMLAAGWGGTGTVSAGQRSVVSAVKPVRAGRSQHVFFSTVSPSDVMDDSVTEPARARKLSQNADKIRPKAFLETLCETVKSHLRHSGAIKDIEIACQSLNIPIEIRVALNEVEQLGMAPGLPWLLLVRWADRKRTRAPTESFPGVALLRLSRLDSDLVKQANQIFDRTLASFPAE
jgi:Ca-activated chloride channel family protein